jgi:hypothetical protein
MLSPRVGFAAPVLVVRLSLVVLAACGAGAPTRFAGVDAGAPAAIGSDAGKNGEPGGPSSDAGSVLTISDASLTVPSTLLYAHDSTTLYQIDPTDPKLAATSLGAFDCIGSGGASSMTDFAVDDSQNLFGLATSTVFVDMKAAPGGVQCAQGKLPISAGSVSADRAKFYGESFAPKGTLDPNAQALVVGNNQGEMYVVDLATGALTIVGTFGAVPANDGNGNAYPSGSGGGDAGTPFQMSGDIVFLDNGGSPVGFATVRDCSGASTCSKVDTLVELDLTKMKRDNTDSIVKAVRGQVRRAASCADAKSTSYGSMYGIAAYRDKIIGFSHDGLIVSISNVDGTACLIHDYSGTIAFDGAGVTTKGPVTAPPPK